MSHHRFTRDERGFSMFLVIMALLTTALFVAAAYAAANGDLPMSGQSKDRKITYAAAEAGLNFYENHLNQDNDYWTKCDTVPAPNATEQNPVNQAWDGAGSDPRRWRTVPGSNAEYTVELLPAKGYTKCDPKDQKSLIDLTTGTFRLRFTGSPGPHATTKQRRSVVATFRRDGFLNFLYFTDFEDRDPQADSTQAARDERTADCADKYRAQRDPTKCVEIQFISADKVNGPLHSNDSPLICGSPTFGRDAGDRIETAAPKPGIAVAGGCTNSAQFKGVFKYGVRSLEMPSTNTQLKQAAQANGYYYVGKTIVRLNGSANTITVTTTDPVTKITSTKTVAPPLNGVIYVDQTGSCNGNPPPVADYNESSACGNAYVSGTYATSMTIGAANDIIVKPTNGGVLSTSATNSDITRLNDSTLGLIANNFVRVGHACDRSASPDANAAPFVTDVKIDAAILSLQHSFMVDNYDCGTPLGNLTVTGAIAQKYRGPVGMSSGGSVIHGYVKNYTYDDRLRYRSPPYFLSPVDAAWGVIKANEQVPAR